MIWQPIETAPTTGEEILGSGWLVEKGRPIGMVREPFVTLYDPILGGFHDNPTHWVLLPGAPELAEGL